MFRFLRRWAFRLAILFLLVWLGTSAGSVSYVIGWAALGWVLFRAWPGLSGDVRTLRALLPGPRSTRHGLSDVNAGF